MVDAIRQPFSMAEYTAQLRARNATEVGVDITPTTSKTQTAADRANLATEQAIYSDQSSTLTALITASRASRTEDVSKMGPEQAEGRLAQLQFLRKLGGIEHMGVDASKGDQKTASLDTFMGWLAERAGAQNAVSSSPQNVSLPQIIDLKV